MLASGRHVSIGGTEFFLHEGAERPYQHAQVPQTVNRVDISGRPGRQNVEEGLLLWAMDDWSRGEGVKYFDPQVPAAYWQGNCNPRRPGQVAPPPTRTDSSFDINRPGSSETPVVLFNAGGALWAAGSKYLRRTIDGSTWSTITSGIQAGGRVTAATGASGQKWAYVWDTDSPASDTGTAEIRRVDSAGTNATFFAAGPSTADALGMCYLTGNIYTWTGVRLWSYDTNGSLPLGSGDRVNVYTPGGIDARPSPFYGDAIATRNTVVAMQASRGDTSLYSYNPAGVFKSDGTAVGVGTQLEPLPRGFTGRCLGYSLGVVYVAGTYGGKGALFAYSSVASQPLFLGFLRFGIEDLTPISLAAGQGAQMLIGTLEGLGFVYDSDLDAISELDEAIISPDLRALATYTDLRVAAYDDLVTETIFTSAWEPDDDASEDVDGEVESGIYDFDLPEATKQLMEFRLTFPELTSGQTITVSYALDDMSDAPSYTALTTISTVGETSHTITTSSSAGSTLTFKNLRYKLTLVGGIRVATCTAVAEIADFTEKWDLVVKIAEPLEGVQSEALQPTAREQVDALLSFKVAKDVVSFIDGYDSDLPGTDTTTQDVLVESCEIDLSSSVGGVARVVLKKVP